MDSRAEALRPRVARAVSALLKHVRKGKKRDLLETGGFVSIVLALKKVPAVSRVTKPYRLKIPHSLHGEESDSSICIIIERRASQKVIEARPQIF